MRLISNRAANSAMSYGAVIEALREMFRAGCESPLRHHHNFTIPDDDSDGTLLLMPSWQSGGYLGIKIVTVVPGNAPRGMPTIQGNYLVFDATTGTPLAALDAKELTVRRTACASALAADYLARDDAAHLLMVGAGALAPHLIGAHASVRPIEKVMIWNRHAEKAHELAKSIAEQGMAAEGTEDLEAAVGAADIISCATMSRAPLVRGNWLKPGVHVDLVGAFSPDMRESDDEAVAISRVFVDTRDGALKEGGDIVQAVAAGAMKEKDIQADLFQLCRGEASGRGSREEITLFKSVGAALEDLAAAILVIEKT